MKFTNKYKFFSKAILVLLISLTLQSCFVAKDYERPELVETENLFRTDNLPTDSVSIADVSWKTLFTDQFLQHYVEEGLRNNMDVRIAIQQMIAAEAYAKQGKAGYLPSVGIGANATYQELSENSQFGSLFNEAIDQYDVTANLSWEADIWGKIRSNKRATQAAYLQSVSGHQAVKTQLISSIVNTYYNLLALDAQLEVTKETITTRESSVETIKALKDAGQVTLVAVDQNVAQYNNAKALQVDIEIAIFKTENTLSILLGKAPQHFERSSLDKQKIEQDITLGVPATLLSNRPDVMAAEYSLIQSFELTNVAISNFYPSLTLTASGGFQSLELDNLLSVNSLFANILGGLTQPLFNQRRLKTQKEVTLAQQEQSLLLFKRTLLVAGGEVSNALFSYKSETKKFEFRKNEVEALRAAESNSEALLKNGYANYLDLLTARESALTAELNIIDSKLQQLVAIVDLYEALGGGWR
ncbi:efflux transporter, outer membrane factor (OMF) lipoprotein, NodT family [Psychroflexus torquis ATCC 700755]|uniref:Efflux transporter, outer membrane factor (OMF) lipoprotein, NodT family n=1 Tax=Psychroflexus torquis (strain ATCC 700755 / CIP 106069 / ACAM 623) TaxID=313595 RepID=K4IHQ1_PSYTT|nr:efflux transporter outer membrane subunit [Psychroflexus torquis]AFU70052.1 efflux transporter, outer membrane factor (OMF) lipoprotein, NodT family [Psychroflexus torquis ATCC 700755]